MFKPGKIEMLIGAKKRGDLPTFREVDAMIDSELGIAFHPIPRGTVLYRRCKGGFMYTRCQSGGAIPVYPAPADAETAALFATTIAKVTVGGLDALSWDERNELAQAWAKNKAGNWAEVLPEEAVI
jgi:hypothetical protein